MIAKYPFVAAAVFIWIGFVCAISFFEAWLKFRAPGLTLPVGLGIGRIVFNALNKMEWLFILAIATYFLFAGPPILLSKNIFLLVPFILLLLQTFWLLPLLDERVDLYMHEIVPPPSNLHLYFVIGEVLKVTCLLIFGIQQFKS